MLPNSMNAKGKEPRERERERRKINKERQMRLCKFVDTVRSAQGRI